MCPRKVASCDARRAMTSASTTKAKRQAQQQCTAANCPRSARLDAVLTENAFLGETVATLQNAVQVANHRADALAQEVESLQTRRKELEAVAEKACGAAQRMSTLERQLEDVSNKCRLLREEKTDLLERSWETLEQLRLTRQRNDRLEQRLSELHEEIDQEVLHSRLCASKHIISKVEQLRENRGQVALDDFEAVAAEIEILEAQALAGERLEAELHAEQQRSAALHDRLQQALADEKRARDLVASYAAREAHLLRQLRHEVQRQIQST